MTQTRTDQTAPWRETAWDVALLFPPQGEWSEQDYLALDTNRPVEFCDGHIEVLEMPTALHHMACSREATPPPQSCCRALAFRSMRHLTPAKRLG